jgi:vesicle-associated membrane protein 4
MQNNITKAMNRGEQLDTLQNKTENLQQSSMQFKRGANQVRFFWPFNCSLAQVRKEIVWKDMKLKLIIGGVVAVVIILVIVVIRAK